jgi:hypothetical protein
MLTTLVFAVVATVGLWFTWNARTYGQRSTDAMLKAWAAFDQCKDGRRFRGTDAQIVFYRCRHNWQDQRAEFLILGRTTRGQWFEAEGKVFAARKVTPFTVVRTLTDTQAQEWLGRFQAHSEIRRYFGAIEIA